MLVSMSRPTPKVWNHQTVSQIGTRGANTPMRERRRLPTWDYPHTEAYEEVLAWEKSL